tara:strand:- start:8 stop:5611 length:5604 start_codon:yes stop_codon:yes gene_type:complete
MADLVAENSIPRIDIKNIEDLNTILVDRKFGRPEDYIEIFILDLNNTILSTIPNFKQYNTGQNIQGLTDEINIDPLSLLNGRGFFTGTYKIHVNIQKRKIFNTTTPAFKIKEISGTKTELSLTTLEGGNTSLDTNSRNFISQIQNSTYFRDFTLNFGKNKNITAVNIGIDKSNPNEFLLNIKLLKPLPGNFKEGDKLNIVEDITEPIVMTYDLGALPPVDTTTPLRGPNFKIDTRLNSSVPLAFKSYDDLLATNTTSSYQKLISKLDGYEIPEIDYSYVKPVHSASLGFETITPSHFENFVHFGSAVELLKNFQYKVKLIELYDIQLSELYNIPGGTSTSTITSVATSSIITKKDNLIQGFSGYEQFLYFTTGSNPYTWPKASAGEPYKLAHTTSSEAVAWVGHENSFHQDYGGQILSASTFDSQNPNRLFKLTPTYIGDKDENKPFELFCDMVGEQFDPIWTHTKELTQIRDNSHTVGISKNLVYYALQSLGIETYDQFENEDLLNYMFGETLIPKDSSTVITSTSEITSKQDLTKEIWKRLYHNAPYLLKTKGTERGLRALINCYGIPATILDIKEFGSSNPSRDDIKLYTYEKFTQVISGNSLDGSKRGMFIETEWSSSLTNDMSASAKTVEFRIKPKRTTNDHHLFSLTSNIKTTVSGSDLHLTLQPYTGSDDIYVTNDRTQYGRLNLHQFTSSIALSDYFPIYNKSFWDISLSTDGISGSNSTVTFGAYQSNHLREVLYYTQSVSITEQTNAESFGNPYYNSGMSGVKHGYFGGIKTTITNGIVTSSNYTNDVTQSFDIGYEGSLSEIRYYFGEQLSHETLKLHALEPLMYNGNSISSSYDHLIVRYPLSFELDLTSETNNMLPSSSYAWNIQPSPVTPGGTTLTGPITGGAILSASGYYETGSAPYQGMANQPSSYGGYSGQPFSGSLPFVHPPSGSTLAESIMFTVAGTPLLSSHHPNQNINYLDGFTYFQATDVELLNEIHHLPTPNTIGKSPLNQKVYIDSGSTDDDILSPDILSQLPITERQVPDFNNIGVFLSPQNEINEDIIYTLGSFSLDEFLGDPREETLETYTSFEPLFTQYFKKLKKGTDRYNIWDFTRWMQFLDHTLFELIKKFTPQKSIDKTGLLIEPHFLERPKFKRHHPITSRPQYDGTIQEVTQSFSKNSNRSQLDNTTGSAVLSQYNFIGTGSDGKALGSGYDTDIDVAKALSGSSTWEQGPLVPNSTGSVKQRNSNGSNELRPWTLTPQGNFLNSRVSRKKFKPYPSPELVKNGTFTGITQAENIGSLGSTHLWQTQDDWTIGSGKAIAAGASINDHIYQWNRETSNAYTRYKVTFTISDYSGGKIRAVLYGDGNSYGFGPDRNANGTYTETITLDGVGGSHSNALLMQVRNSAFTGKISNISAKEIDTKEKAEFDDSLTDMVSWKRSRYEGSKLTGAKINEYTAGDITYGLNPVVEQSSVALYFGKTLIGAGGTEDDSLATIKNHSYVDIEKILLVNKYSDEVTIIDLKNETYEGINGYIARDFKDGSSFNIELLDNKITHKLKDSYSTKFNQGYLYKTLEHNGTNGTGNISGQGIQVGYIDSSSADLFSSYVDTSQNILCYGDYNSTMNSDTLTLKSNTLTKKIWPVEQSFGLVDFVTSSANYVYSKMQDLSVFYNSMLIPVASESQYRLFGTVNLGQPLMVADYSANVDKGIRSISTFELDLEKYNISSSSTLHTLISASSAMSGFGKPLLQPHSFVIPIMQGPHDVITTEKANSGITWPGNGGTAANHASTSNGKVEFQNYFHGNSAQSAIYQISYLEETNTLIANIDKPTELTDGVGDEGYILIPGSIDKEISDNLDFYLDKAGIKSNSDAKKSPPRGV